MEKSILVGIDLGTTTLKAVFADIVNYRIITTQTEEIKPAEADQPGWIEYDPKDWLDGTARLLKRGYEQGVDPKKIAGLCFSGWTVTALLADSRGQPLTNAIHYNDMRHLDDLPELEAIAGERCVRGNGNYIGVYNGLAKQYWWKKRRPEIFGRARSIHTEATWMVKQLTSVDAWNRAEAGFYGQYNAYSRDWDNDVIDLIGFPRDIHPKLYDPWEIVGAVTKEASLLTGLPEGTPVAAGADDASPVALASGVLNAGQCYCSAGSAANIVVNMEKPVSHPTVITYPHCIPGLTVAATVMSSTGLSNKWARDALCQAETAVASVTGDDTYDYMNRAAARVRPGSGGVIFLPYLDGDYTPNNDANARGCFIGMDASTTKADLLRAVLEGVAFSILDNINLIRGLGGTLDEIVLSGGLSKSEIWMQIISDVTGCNISLPGEAEGAALGDALIAGFGAGLIGSYETAVRRLVTIRRGAYTPDAENHRLYQYTYNIYKELYPALKHTFLQLADGRRKNGGSG